MKEKKLLELVVVKLPMKSIAEDICGFESFKATDVTSAHYHHHQSSMNSQIRLEAIFRKYSWKSIEAGGGNADHVEKVTQLEVGSFLT